MFLPWDANLSQEFPAYTYIVCAIGVLFYQTLDAVDGK
jgi:hypothetical protein